MRSSGACIGEAAGSGIFRAAERAQREKLDRAIDEYVAGVLQSSERGGAHLELAVFYESMGRFDKAMEAYRTAIRVEPGLTGPRSNLAALLEQTSELEQRRVSELISRGRGTMDPNYLDNLVAKTQQEMQRRNAEITRLRDEELKLLERDVSLIPDNGPLQYRYGLSLHLHHQPEKAQAALEKACELEPDNDQFLFALALFYDNQEEYGKSLQRAEQALRLRPEDQQYQQFRDAVKLKLEQQTSQ